jgi:hypothetical protein
MGSFLLSWHSFSQRYVRHQNHIRCTVQNYSSTAMEGLCRPVPNVVAETFRICGRYSAAVPADGNFWPSWTTAMMGTTFYTTLVDASWRSSFPFTICRRRRCSCSLTPLLLLVEYVLLLLLLASTTPADDTTTSTTSNSNDNNQNKVGAAPARWHHGECRRQLSLLWRAGWEEGIPRTENVKAVP